MGFKKSKFEAVTIECSGNKIPGQDHRCSYNFDMKQLVETPRMRWTVEPIDGVDLSKVKFYIMKDCSGSDEKLYEKKITNGKVIPFVAEGSLYIADVEGVGNKNFRITITPTFDHA